MKKATLDLQLSLKKTRNRECLQQMEKVLPWLALVASMAPYYPEGRTGRPPFSLETMLRIHLHSSSGSRCRTQRGLLLRAGWCAAN